MKNVFSVAILTVTFACSALTHAAADVFTVPNSPADVDDCSVHPSWPDPIGGGWNELYADASASSLVKFNTLPNIPGAWVTSATLRLYAWSGGLGGDFTLHEAQSSWAETTLTKAIWDTWHVHGGLTAFSVAAGNYVDIDVTSTVAAWLSGSSPNNGWAIESAGGTIYFASSEHSSALSPTLKIDYTAPAENRHFAPNTPADVDDDAMNPGWAAGLVPNYPELLMQSVNYASAIRFNVLPSVDAGDVLVATLRVKSITSAGGTWTLHEAVGAWVENNVAYGDATIGIPGWGPVTYTLGAVGTWTEMDVTDIVKGWLGGSPNYGVVLEGSGIYAAAHSSDAVSAANRPTLEIIMDPSAVDIHYADNSAANVDDTSVNPAWTVAGQNPGAWTECYAYDPAANTAALIKFNSLPSVPGALVLSAKLILVGKLTSGDLTVHASTVDWDEATLEWGNWGEVGTFPHGGTAGTITAGDFTEIDVTAIVTAWLSGSSPNYGVVLTGVAGNYPDFRSSEDAFPVLRPQLRITATSSPPSGSMILFH